MSGSIQKPGLSLRYVERTKFIAAVLDKLALAIAVTAFVSPLVNGRLQHGFRTIVAFIWLGFAIVVWVAAFIVLGRLR